MLSLRRNSKRDFPLRERVIDTDDEFLYDDDEEEEEEEAREAAAVIPCTFLLLPLLAFVRAVMHDDEQLAFVAYDVIVSFLSFVLTHTYTHRTVHNTTAASFPPLSSSLSLSLSQHTDKDTHR